jgi:hypothetical protein
MRSATRLRILRVLELHIFEPNLSKETPIIAYQREDIGRFMGHIVQLFAIFCALRIARDYILRNAFEFFEGKADESLEVMNNPATRNDLLTQPTFSSLKFF